jgi:2',3'-cyclic-nucleotide 2'-phosphodiesterase (5'-nucleotidase family)
MKFPELTLPVLLALQVPLAAAAAPEAVVVVAGDLHSAYERSAQFVALVDAVRARHPGTPLAVAINGDAFELGNAVARRSEGEVDYAFLAALARRGPLIVNLGNHEPDFHDVPETIRRLRATGAQLVAGNLRDPATGVPYVAASVDVPLGRHRVRFIGVTTDRLATFRVAVRPQLDLADPVVWARSALPGLLPAGEPLVLLSHAGVPVDRQLLPLVPDGTLVAGAHDHLRFTHEAGRTAYFHTGSWLEAAAVARLERDAAGLRWRVALEDVPAAPADPELAGRIREVLARHLTPEDAAVVGRGARALSPSEAARFVVEAARRAASADAAMIGATTFGAGLPAGDVPRHAFDACVRFDGPLFAATVDGAWLLRLQARCNQGSDTPFAERGGENLVFAAAAPIEAGRRYRLVTSDWAARQATRYFGPDAPAFAEVPGVTLKAAALAALRP